VRQKIEIHNYERRIATVLEKINKSSISQRNKELILDFYREHVSCGLSKARQYKYLYTLERLAREFKRDFEL
jgi:predicted ATPase